MFYKENIIAILESKASCGMACLVYAGLQDGNKDFTGTFHFNLLCISVISDQVFSTRYIYAIILQLGLLEYGWL